MKPLLYILLLSVCFVGCKKDKKDNTPQQQVTTEQGLSDDELSYWESLGVDTTFKTGDLIFEDGSGVRDWLDAHDPLFLAQFLKTTKPTGYDFLENELPSLIASSTYAAGWLTEDEHFADLGQRNGIAYVWGASDYIPLSSCEDATPSVNCVCTEQLHGLDCSGYIYHIFHTILNIGIERANTTTFANVETWNKAFAKSAQYKGIKAVDKGHLTAGQLKEGDIIVKPGHHMGMIVRTHSGLKFANSLGSYSRSCGVNNNSMHGPVVLPVRGSLAGELNQSYIAGYKVIRFENVNTCYAGFTAQGPLVYFPHLNAPSPYDGHIGLINADFAIELDPALQKLVQVGSNYGFVSPDIPGFHTLKNNIPYSVESAFSNNGGQVKVSLYDGAVVYAGTVNGERIDGTLTVNTTYTDEPSGMVTPTTMSCDMVLMKKR